MAEEVEAAFMNENEKAEDDCDGGGYCDSLLELHEDIQQDSEGDVAVEVHFWWLVCVKDVEAWMSEEKFGQDFRVSVRL